MPPSPAELSALSEIERALSSTDPRPVVWRRASTWIGLLIGATCLVVGGLVSGNAAAVVLGTSWAVAAVASLWASRHLAVAATPPGELGAH